MLYREAMDVLGVSYSTLKRYVKKGLIRTYIYQTPKLMGKMNYWDDDVYALVGHRLQRKAGAREVAAYFRVNQKTGPGKERMLEQKRTVMGFCAGRGISIDRTYEDWSSSIEAGAERRPDWHRLLQDVMKGDVAALVVETRCRLSRFAWGEIEQLFKYHQCDIIVVNKVLDDLFYRDEQSEDLARQIEVLKMDRHLDSNSKG
jgi:predicted site-specific integrase-resolvase